MGDSRSSREITCPLINLRDAQVQYVERHTRYGVMKCYCQFVVGPYYCHWFFYPHWFPYPY